MLAHSAPHQPAPPAPNFITSGVPFRTYITEGTLHQSAEGIISIALVDFLSILVHIDDTGQWILPSALRSANTSETCTPIRECYSNHEMVPLSILLTI
ncbi:MAG: hypothetical protein ACTS6G_05675 [Candidatus Hodgkinia cicadicola]